MIFEYVFARFHIKQKQKQKRKETKREKQRKRVKEIEKQYTQASMWKTDSFANGPKLLRCEIDGWKECDGTRNSGNGLQQPQ